MNDKGEGNPVQKGATSMAKTKTKKRTKVVDDEPVQDDDLLDDDFVELDEADDDEEPADDPTEGMLSAKEAAKAIGTDARTLRKYLRKKSGKVGQGNRWLIDPDDLDDLKTNFEASMRPKADDDEAPKTKTKSKTKKSTKKKDPKPDPVDEDEDDDDEEDDDGEFEVLDEIDDL